MIRLPITWLRSADLASPERPHVPSSNRAYVRSQNNELRQAELITDLYYYIVESSDGDESIVDTEILRVEYSFIMTPDCDLLQDYKKRRRGEGGALSQVLLFEAAPDDVAKAMANFGRPEWKKVKNNEIERYHYLEPIASQFDAAGEGGIITPIVIDFKKYYTLPPKEIERQCARTRPEDRAARRCYLSELWREHLQRRAMSYMQRVALPDDDDVGL